MIGCLIERPLGVLLDIAWRPICLVSVNTIVNTSVAYEYWCPK